MGRRLHVRECCRRARTHGRKSHELANASTVSFIASIRLPRATTRSHERTVGWSNSRRTPENYGTGNRKLRDQAMRQREVDQLGAVFDAKRFHHPIFVIFYGSR